MGLGLALMEETQFDERTGRIANPSLAEYHLPVHMDVPAIDVIWTDIADPHAPMGARGIGEIGITGTGARSGQRRLQRLRQARPRPADHPRQADVKRKARGSAPRPRQGLALGSLTRVGVERDRVTLAQHVRR